MFKSNNNKVLVSVIITNFNYDQYLKDSIESVLNQTYQNIEVIIVDDGSTDGSKEIILDYAKKYGTLIHPVFKKNGGQASAFNSGFLKTNGEIITFLDSDDCWMPEKLERTVHAFSQGAHVLVQHRHFVINENGKVDKNRIWPKRYNSGNVYSKYFIENHTDYFSTTSGIACLRNCLNEYFPLDESWKICADVPLTRPIPIFGPILSIDEPLGYYRIHSDNKWMNSSEQKRWIENQISHCDYLNSIFEIKNIKKRINFKKSIKYRIWEINNDKIRGRIRRVVKIINLIKCRIVISLKLIYIEPKIYFNRPIGYNLKRLVKFFSKLKKSKQC